MTHWSSQRVPRSSINANHANRVGWSGKAIGLAAVMALAGVAQATPTVTLTLVVGQSNGGATGIPGQWTLYADDSVGDNYGIVAIGVGLCTQVGVPTNSTDLTIINDLPQIAYWDSTLESSPNPLNAGFVAARMAQANSYIGTPGPIPFTGAMDTTNGTGLLVIQGFGQRAGSFPAIESITDASGGPYDSTGPATQTTWAAHLQIAHGIS